MAIGLLKQTFVKRASGGHVVGKAAYISGQSLQDELQERTYSAESSGVLLEGLLTPESAPEWANSREALWNAVEAREKRKDSTLARDLVLALPHELDLKSNQRLLESFLRGLLCLAWLFRRFCHSRPSQRPGGGTERRCA